MMFKLEEAKSKGVYLYYGNECILHLTKREYQELKQLLIDNEQMVKG